MAYDFSRLANIQTIADSAGSLYANPISKKSFITGIIIHNTNTTAETVILYNVPDSAASLGAAAVTNQIFKKDIEPDDTIEWDLPKPGIILEDQNDSLQGTTTTASKVTITLMGAVE